MYDEALKIYLEDVVKDMASQNEKVPVTSFRVVITVSGAQLFAPDWFKYMITGRGPGKMPPLERIADWLEKNFQGTPVRENKDGTFSIMTMQSLAYAIGVKIAKQGTDIWIGKRKGIDFLGAMERNMPDLLAELTKNSVAQIQTALHQKV